MGRLNDELDKLRKDLSKAEFESSKYSGGLIKVLDLTRIASVQNSIVFLEQKRLLLKHDIPIYSIVTKASSESRDEFKKTPGEDINKF